MVEPRLTDWGGFDICDFASSSSELGVYEPSLTDRGGFDIREFAQLLNEIGVFELELDRASWLRHPRTRAILERNRRVRACALSSELASKSAHSHHSRAKSMASSRARSSELAPKSAHSHHSRTKSMVSSRARSNEVASKAVHSHHSREKSVVLSQVDARMCEHARTVGQF